MERARKTGRERGQAKTQNVEEGKLEHDKFTGSKIRNTRMLGIVGWKAKDEGIERGDKDLKEGKGLTEKER